MLDKIEFSMFVKHILHYIAGYIVHKLALNITCMHCTNLILAEKPDHTYYVQTNASYAFTHFVNRSKLYFPSKAVEQIISVTEKVFKTQIIIEGLSSKNFKSNIVRNVIQILQLKLQLLFHPPHPITNTTSDSHELYLISHVVEQYVKIRMYSYSKKVCSKLLGQRETMRQKLHKTILFYHI